LFCDVALQVRIEPLSLVTISLAIDFLAPAEKDQWLQIDTNFIKTGSSICFAQCLVSVDRIPCARANATFKVLRQKT
jgi:acyl-coenzyme A thioesterase PaaI-like protein